MNSAATPPMIEMLPKRGHLRAQCETGGEQDAAEIVATRSGLPSIDLRSIVMFWLSCQPIAHSRLR
jgi:hypothetical protein